MPNLITHRRLDAVCEYELGGRQIHLRVTGLITPSVMPVMLADLSRISHGVLARSIVVDCSTAAVALSYEDLLAAPGMLRRETRQLVRAVIPPYSVLDVFREHALARAQLGEVLGVFRESGKAQAWAAQKEDRLHAFHSRIREAAL